MLSKRKDALTAGDRHYLTGKPCARGHIAVRFSGSGTCTECASADSSSENKKEYDRLRYQNDRDSRLAQAKTYSEANKNAVLGRIAQWQSDNPEKVRAYKSNYKHMRRQKEGQGISWSALLAWKNEQKKVCYWCGTPCKKSYHVDHYNPLSKGGLHETDNLVIACPPCNQRKSAKDPYEFAAQVGRLF